MFFLAQSPVFSHLSSSLRGLTTIRAFKVQQSFQQMFDDYQDLHTGKNTSIDNNHFSLSGSLYLYSCTVYEQPAVWSFTCDSNCDWLYLVETWFLFLAISRWFAIRLDGICSIFVTITAFGCIYLNEGNVFDLTHISNISLKYLVSGFICSI